MNPRRAFAVLAYLLFPLVRLTQRWVVGRRAFAIVVAACSRSYWTKVQTEDV